MTRAEESLPLATRRKPQLMNMGYYPQNLAALRKTHAEAAERISGLGPLPTSYRLLPTKTPYPTLEVSDTAGKIHLWHSRYDPIKEAEREMASIPHTGIFVPLFAGIGLGYGPCELWKQRQDDFYDLVLVEKDPFIFRLALETTPLEEMLAYPRTHVFLGDDLSAWETFVRSLMPAVMSCNLWTVAHPASQACDQEFYRAAFTKLQQRIQLTTKEFDLMIRSGPQIQENLWRNLAPAMESIGLNEVRGSWSKQPAVVVAAGPSLDKNVRALQDLQANCMILAVDTAYRTLLQNGIEPHVIVSTDPTELNLRHFEGITPSRETLLAFDPEVYYQIPNRWPGRKLFLNLEKAAFTRWLDRLGDALGFLPKGGSVGHTAFYLARELGADPIIFAGLDLAYDPEGGRTHTAGASLGRDHGRIAAGTVDANLGPTGPFAAMRETIVWVPGVEHERVPTSHVMALYINQFCEEFRKTEARLIDATEGGARLEGTEILPLREVKSLLSAPGRDVREFLRAWQPRARDRVMMRQEFEKIEQSLRTSQDEANRGRSFCAKLFPMISQGKALRNHPTWLDMEDSFNRIYQSEAVKIALEQALFEAIYHFIKKEREDEVGERLEKYRQFFEAYIKMYPNFEKCIHEVMTMFLVSG